MHTQGPWQIHAHENAGDHPNHAFRFVGTADFDEESVRGEIIAKMTDSPNIRDNARLISAAPDLLAACEEALNAMCGPYAHNDDPESPTHDPVMANARRVVRAALLKVEGGA